MFRLKLKYLAIALSSLIALSCADVAEEDTDSTTPEQPEPEIDIEDKSIRQIIADHYGADIFDFGAAGQIWYTEDLSNIFVKRWIEEFSHNTPENDFKQMMIYKELDASWYDDNYIAHIDIARDNGQSIRAHCPISPQISSWVMEDERTADELEQMMEEFLTRISIDIERNKDVVQWMDVVNETCPGSRQKGTGYDGALSSNTFIYEADDWFGPRVGSDGWENPWTMLGFNTVVMPEGEFEGEEFSYPIYIEQAFRLANEYAPSVKKIFNSTGDITETGLWDKAKMMILYLKSQGVQVDGIGWQCHISMDWPTDENRQALDDLIKWCYANDLEFHITELNIVLDWSANMDDELLETREEQSEAICAVVETMLKNVGKGARTINMWVMNDLHDRGTFGSLFDRDCIENQAYYDVKDLLIKYKLKN